MPWPAGDVPPARRRRRHRPGVRARRTGRVIGRARAARRSARAGCPGRADRSTATPLPSAPPFLHGAGVDLFEHGCGLHRGAGGDRLLGVADHDRQSTVRRAHGGTRRCWARPPTSIDPAVDRRRATATSRGRRRAHRRRRRASPGPAPRGSRRCAGHGACRWHRAVRCALAVEVRQQRGPIAVRRRAPDRSNSWWSTPSSRATASMTLAAFSVQTSGRNRPVASAKPATSPDGSVVGDSHTANAVPDVPAEITASPVRRPTPSAAAMLSPVPGATTAPFHSPADCRAGRGPRAATSLQSRAASMSASTSSAVRPPSPATSSRCRTHRRDRSCTGRSSGTSGSRAAGPPGPYGPTPSGCVRCSHDSFVTVNAATGTLPTASTHAARPASPPPNWAISHSASGADSVSFQSFAGWTGPSSASRATMPCCWPPTLIAAIDAGAAEAACASASRGPTRRPPTTRRAPARSPAA